MSEVYSPTQRLRPHVVSKNHRILTAYRISLSLEDMTRPCGTQHTLSAAELDHRLLACDLHHFVFLNRSQLSHSVTSFKLQHQQESLKELQFLQMLFHTASLPLMKIMMR